jgi:hypothetical protein
MLKTNRRGRRALSSKKGRNMKFSFSKDVEYVPEWNGNDKLPAKEQIKCTLTVLNMNELMILVDAFTKAGITGEEQIQDTAAMKPILDQMGPLLPKHVKMKGLFDDSGKAITMEEIVEYPIFLNLCVELLMKLSEISSPSDDDAKN